LSLDGAVLSRDCFDEAYSADFDVGRPHKTQSAIDTAPRCSHLTFFPPSDDVDEGVGLEGLVWLAAGARLAHQSLGRSATLGVHHVTLLFSFFVSPRDVINNFSPGTFFALPPSPLQMT